MNSDRGDFRFSGLVRQPLSRSGASARDSRSHSGRRCRKPRPPFRTDRTPERGRKRHSRHFPHRAESTRSTGSYSFPFRTAANCALRAHSFAAPRTFTVPHRRQGGHAPMHSAAKEGAAIIGPCRNRPQSGRKTSMRTGLPSIHEADAAAPMRKARKQAPRRRRTPKNGCGDGTKKPLRRSDGAAGKQCQI